VGGGRKGRREKGEEDVEEIWSVGRSPSQPELERRGTHT